MAVDYRSCNNYTIISRIVVITVRIQNLSMLQNYSRDLLVIVQKFVNKVTPKIKCTFKGCGQNLSLNVTYKYYIHCTPIDVLTTACILTGNCKTQLRLDDILVATANGWNDWDDGDNSAIGHPYG